MNAGIAFVNGEIAIVNTPIAIVNKGGRVTPKD